MATIRLARDDDATAMSALYAPYVRDTAITFELEAPDADEFRKRLHAVRALAPWLVVDDGGTLLGYAYAGPWRARAAYRFVVEGAVYVGVEHTRRGVGGAVYGALLEVLRAQGFHRVVGGITLPNEASVGLHEHLGFRAVGTFPRCGHKLGAWWDVGFWELALQATDNEPREPRAVDEALGDDDIQQALAARAHAIAPRMDTSLRSKV
jgi:L-amino acid N-acyltransferase YncA